MLYTEVKYLKMVAARLPGFQIKKDTGSEFLANCKCNYCEKDSEGKKKRGYFFNKGQLLLYFCHNCQCDNGKSVPFGKWLREFDYNVWNEYNVEVFKERHDFTTFIASTPKVEPRKIVPDIFYGLKSIFDLRKDHPARLVIEKRKLPLRVLDELFFVPKFFKWSLGHTDKFKVMQTKDHPRLIIPWYAEDDSVIGYQARSFGFELPKYFSIILNKSKPKIYGLDRIDWGRRIYVVEGPLDSLFLDNSIAVGDAALHKFVDSRSVAVTYVPDNEPRNREILKEYRRLVESGKETCIMPESWPYKDINDAIIAGFDSQRLQEIIDENTYQGPTAALVLSKWKKVEYEEKR